MPLRSSVTTTGLIVVVVVTVACALHPRLQIRHGHLLAVDREDEIGRHEVVAGASLVAKDEMVPIDRDHLEIADSHRRASVSVREVHLRR